MSAYWWDDLSSDELVSRLHYHGLAETYAQWLVDRRGRVDADAIIERTLKGDS